jgi:hypothetical protein
MHALKALLKQPYWVIALVFGVPLVSFPCPTVDTDYHLTSHPPTTLLPVVLGIALLVLSSTAFGFTLLAKRTGGANALCGLDLKRVTEANGALWTNVSGCRIQVLNGRIEEYRHEPGAAIVLPCNEYFEDRCAHYGHGGQRLRRVTIVVFQGSADSPPPLDKVVVRRGWISLDHKGDR